MLFKNNLIAAITTFIIFGNVVLVLILEYNSTLFNNWKEEEESLLSTTTTIIPQQEINNNPSQQQQQYLCEKNPFITSLQSSLTDISYKIDDWMLHQNEKLQEIENISSQTTAHHRFKAFEKMAECSSSRSGSDDIKNDDSSSSHFNNSKCIGGPCFKDGSKFMCGDITELNDIHNCIVYSFGSNDEWEFEVEIIQKTQCHVYVFDCTGSRQRFHIPLQSPRLTFYHTCLGDKYIPAPVELSPSLVVLPNFPLVAGVFMTLEEIQKMLNHDQVHLMKMDVEGFEWSILESWKSKTTTRTTTDNTNDATSTTMMIELPWQIITEVHYITWIKNKIKIYNEADMILLVSHIHSLGYATVFRENNILCDHCCEITLIRYNHCM